jgi:ABC-type branched-subunit amino acid transport system substrate-binding protein
MKRHIRLRAGVVGTLAVVTVAACGTGGSGSGNGNSGGIQTGPGVDASAKTITLGVLTPLTGVAAPIGVPLAAGQADYFKWLDANGGIDGWQVKLTTEDTKYDPQTEVQEYNQILPNVLFIGQSLGSPTTQAIESTAESQGVLIGTAAQDSAFVTHDINAVIGTPYAVDVANAMYYVTQHASSPKIGIVYQNDAYGQDGLKGYLAAQKAYGFDDVGHATYNVTDTSFTSQGLAMKNDGAQYVMLTAIPTIAAQIIGAAAVIGYHPQWILQGPAWSEYLMTTNGALTGTHTPIYPVMLGQWVLGYEAAWGDTSVSGMSQFLQVQQQYSPQQVPDGYYMYGYCLALMERDVLAKAIASGNLTRQGVLQAKLNLGTVDFGGLIPTADYTPNLGPADRQTDIAVVDGSSPGFLKLQQPYFTSSAGQNLTFS